jgi:hypothetical protein
MKKSKEVKTVPVCFTEDRLIRSDNKIKQRLSHPHNQVRHRFVFWISSILIGIAHTAIAIIIIPLFIAVNMFLLGLILALTALVSGLFYHSSLSNIQHLGRHHQLTAVFFLPLLIAAYTTFLLTQTASILPEQLVSAGLITGITFSVPAIFRTQRQDL